MEVSGARHAAARRGVDRPARSARMATVGDLRRVREPASSHRLHRGRLRGRAPVLTRRGRWAAAVLAARTQALLSHRTAASCTRIRDRSRRGLRRSTSRAGTVRPARDRHARGDGPRASLTADRGTASRARAWRALCSASLRSSRRTLDGSGGRSRASTACSRSTTSTSCSAQPRTARHARSPRCACQSGARGAMDSERARTPFPDLSARGWTAPPASQRLDRRPR